MRRSILAAFVAAIALAIGFNAAATAAVDGGAQATAKKKAGKKKAGKKKAGKKKAGKKKAGKKKACKPKKGKKKACKPKKDKKKATPRKPPTGSTFGEGVYRDVSQRVTVRVTDDGSQATFGFPGGKCVANALIYVTGPIAQQGSEVKGSGNQSILGGDGSVKWSLSVSPNLSYKFDAVTSTRFDGQAPCETSKNISSTLEKL